MGLSTTAGLSVAAVTRSCSYQSDTALLTGLNGAEKLSHHFADSTLETLRGVTSCMRSPSDETLGTVAED